MGIFATEHLIENGCRNIVHLSGPQSLSFAKNRIKGFADAIKKHHLEESFRTPSDSVKPWVFWFWINGNISQEGITKDLEAVKETGINGVKSGLIEDVKLVISKRNEMK